MLSPCAICVVTEYGISGIPYAVLGIRLRNTRMGTVKFTTPLEFVLLIPVWMLALQLAFYALRALWRRLRGISGKDQL